MSTSPPSSPASTYDEVPFEGRSLPQTHPSRLFSLATLFGMRPRAVQRCRVLELGCASGSNLIPMAERHPESTFLGIDASQRQIAEGRRIVEILGLKNIELRSADLVELDDSIGTFDYIIAHGLFSWVAPDVQQRLLTLCRARLQPQGVAYLSYNIYPGWHLRGILRELVFDPAAKLQPSAERLARAFNVLEFLSITLAEQPTPYSQLLKQEVDLALRQSESYLFHEYLEDENHPLYFHEFVARAAAQDLQYLGDATLATMFTSNFSPEIEHNLLQMSEGDQVVLEQHVDLLKNRSFRQSLLCRAEVELKRNIEPESLAGLRFSGRLELEGGEQALNVSEAARFVAPSGVALSTPSPVVKGALMELNAQWPHSLSLDELSVAAARRFAASGAPTTISTEEQRNLGRNLVQCLASGILEVHAYPGDFVTFVSPRPLASRMARLQAGLGISVTNRLHEPVLLDEVSQNILHYLDGEHDHPALLQVLIGAVDRGELSILKNGIPASRGEAVRDILETTLEQCLAKLASQALLVA